MDESMTKDARMIFHNHVVNAAQNSKEYVNITTKKPVKMFDGFVKSPFCMELGDSILDYCTYLCKLEKLKT